MALMYFGGLIVPILTMGKSLTSCLLSWWHWKREESNECCRLASRAGGQGASEVARRPDYKIQREGRQRCGKGPLIRCQEK